MSLVSFFMGSNPSTVYLMDIFSLIFVKKLFCLGEKMKTKVKRPGAYSIKPFSL